MVRPDEVQSFEISQREEASDHAGMRQLDVPEIRVKTVRHETKGRERLLSRDL